MTTVLKATASDPRRAAKVEAPTDPDRGFLRDLCERTRSARARRGMTRKDLAAESQVSERYLADLEGGRGNISVLLLQKVAAALNLSLADLLVEQDEQAIELKLIQEFLRRLPPQQLPTVRSQLMRDFGNSPADRMQRIALIGLRGAGKSTLGALLAKELSVPFIELDREVERESGTSLSEIFLLYGQQGYRRYERRSLEKILQQNAHCVIATGGSIVSESGTFDLLLSTCYTVWLKAAPEEHMARVVAQGDTRPMAGNAQAMDDLRRILDGRALLYGQADTVVDTAGRTVQHSLKDIQKALRT
jgi:XRE family aerobic/anaerobic benzoate catabolism transcriptional regulator